MINCLQTDETPKKLNLVRFIKAVVTTTVSLKRYKRMPKTSRFVFKGYLAAGSNNQEYPYRKCFCIIV